MEAALIPCFSAVFLQTFSISPCVKVLMFSSSFIKSFIAFFAFSSFRYFPAFFPAFHLRISVVPAAGPLAEITAQGSDVTDLWSGYGICGHMESRIFLSDEGVLCDIGHVRAELLALVPRDKVDGSVGSGDVARGGVAGVGNGGGGCREGGDGSGNLRRVVHLRDRELNGELDPVLVGLLEREIEALEVTDVGPLVVGDDDGPDEQVGLRTAQEVEDVPVVPIELV